jgi:hypothetical protein
LLNLPDRNAKRDLIHGVRNLEEIAEGWLCARRTLRVLDVSANKWQIEVPGEVVAVFERTHAKWGSWGSWDSETSPESLADTPSSVPAEAHYQPQQQQQPQQQRQPVLQNGQGPYHHSAGGPFQQPAFYSNVPQTQPTNDGRSYGNFNNPHMQVSLPNQQNYLAVNQPYPSLNAVPNPMSSDNRWNTANNQDVSCDNSNSSNSPVAVAGTPPMPVFNGLPEHLMEENQGWWLRDQSSLALGLENWGEGWAGNQFVDVTGVSAAAAQERNDTISRPPAHFQHPGNGRSNFNG